MFTWGNGTTGRLGHQQNEFGALCYDSDHPQYVQAFQVRSSAVLLSMFLFKLNLSG